jgi:hypothetical protein
VKVVVDKFHFTYQTTNLINGKIYIGVHSTTNINDGYLGSGKFLKLAINKYGKENFNRIELDFFKSSKEAYLEESFLVSKSFINNKSNYNASVGGKGGYNGGNGGVWDDARRRVYSDKKKGKLNGMWRCYWVTPIGVFESSRLAAKALNISKSTLLSRCNGFVWQYPKNKPKYKQKVKSDGYYFSKILPIHL